MAHPNAVKQFGTGSGRASVVALWETAKAEITSGNARHGAKRRSASRSQKRTRRRRQSNARRLKTQDRSSKSESSSNACFAAADTAARIHAMKNGAQELAVTLKGLQRIPGIGPSLSRDLVDLGIRRVSDLRGRNPERLYERLVCVARSTTGPLRALRVSLRGLFRIEKAPRSRAPEVVALERFLTPLPAFGFKAGCSPKREVVLARNART